ncbi:MAG TPA: lasso peptide biosynthesis B2 protein [Frateuria sp.]|uniref:lasso peptide biosynthesis B2 protein n=1 Tax=Frateuria sp. TaxID=2211372 RepID=UPI002DF488EA|nr:lasso peptide biosynthesis B2 protein [Frateuria sp.]
MAHYVLRDDLSYCRVGERLVFLDVGKDRYFHLPCPLEQALTAYLDGAGCSDTDRSDLIKRSILVEQTDIAAGSRPDAKPATRSAMEATSQSRNLRVSELIEVFVTVLVTRIALKISTLKSILDGLTADRHAQAARSEPLAEFPERRVWDAAAAFRRARLYVPIEMRCLLDSIAMARFLLRRRVPTHVVFGIAIDPFSAHCWVQVDDLVLNDTVGNVASHTPIRVV